MPVPNSARLFAQLSALAVLILIAPATSAHGLQPARDARDHFLSSLKFMQDRQGTYSLPASQIVHGRPWTSIIPDPDKFDWTTGANGRPGYRYRGMLPMQKKFYDYIKQKQRTNVPLTTAEQSTIRWLISSRRWPEAPRPNAFWAAFMRYLREQPTTDLNLAQGLMVDQLLSRGLVPVDMPADPNFARVRDYLNSGPFRSRNWFERIFGRVEPWMDNLYAGYGFDMRPSAPSGNSFPGGDPFNGLKITYNISGASLSAPVDREGFTISRSYSGVLGTGTLSISGTVRVGGYGADVSLSVWSGDKKEEKKFYIENTGSNGNPQNFSLSVPIPAGARTGGFAIRLDGRYSMGGGHRGCYVTGDFGPSKEQVEADRAAADAKWRQEVEDTLRRLGYQNTPEGKEIEAMRQALAGGDAGWKSFVDSRLEQMRGDTSPETLEYNELENAMTAGGTEWDRYVAEHGTADAAENSGKGATAAALIKQAQNFYERNNYAEAAASYTRAIEAKPDSAAAYAGRGLARRGLQDNAGALADINRALELDPNNADAYRGRSMVKRSQNDFNGALADAHRAVELSPSNHRAYLTRGLAREGLKDTAGALADYDHAIGVNADYPMSWFYRARVRYSAKDYPGALADYNRFISLNPNDSAAFNNRGLVKERLGDKLGAIADYERAIKLNPDNQTAKSNLAKVKPGAVVGADATSETKPPAPLTGPEAELFSSMNIYGVGNRPTANATFSLPRPYVITMVMTYHWNDGRGTRVGTIGLRDAGGRLYGPWSVSGSPGQGGVPNANWTATPNVTLPAGTYAIVDSEPATWSQNAQSGGRGMAIVKGYPSTTQDQTPTPPSTTKAQAVNVVVEDRSNQNVLIWVAGREPRGMQDVLNYHLEPGWKGSLKVTIPADGRINFVAGDGSAGPNGPYDRVIATCTWTGDPKNTSRIPHVVFEASGQLICGTDQK
jgi:tetratricopeptide (TPR) repeat protein